MIGGGFDDCEGLKEDLEERGMDIGCGGELMVWWLRGSMVTVGGSRVVEDAFVFQVSGSLATCAADEDM